MKNPRDNTARLADELWMNGAYELTSAEFQARFDDLYARSEGPATLWRLGAAANEFLMLHPGSIQFPPELVSVLINARKMDGRVFGLKLLARYSSDLPAISAEICKALERRNQPEIYGGLHELSCLLERLQSTEQLPKEKLLASLRELNSSSDPYVRETATRLSEELSSQ